MSKISSFLSLLVSFCDQTPDSHFSTCFPSIYLKPNIAKIFRFQPFWINFEWCWSDATQNFVSSNDPNNFAKNLKITTRKSINCVIQHIYEEPVENETKWLDVLKPNTEIGKRERASLFLYLAYVAPSPIHPPLSTLLRPIFQI